MEQRTVTFEEKKKKLIGRSLWLVLFIFLINYLAMTFYWYSTIWWFDMPMHFLGGFWLGMTGLWAYFFNRRVLPTNVTPGKILLVGLGIVLIVGVGWELFEIARDRLITLDAFNRLDTASDLFFDLAGGATAVLYLLRRRYIN